MTDKSPEIEVKDIAVVLPLASASAAIAYEVGQFLETGGFSLFSLSEHLVAAATALPIAVLAMLFGLLYAPYLLNTTRTKAVVGSLAIVLSVLGIPVLMIGTFTWPVVSELIAIAAAVITSFNLTGRLSAAMRLAALFGAALLAALMLGELSGRALLTRPEVPEASIKTRDGEVSARLIRFGEKGVLLYNSREAKLLFIRADQVISIQQPVRIGVR